MPSINNAVEVVPPPEIATSFEIKKNGKNILVLPTDSDNDTTCASSNKTTEIIQTPRKFTVADSKEILDYWWKKDEHGNYDYYNADWAKWFCGRNETDSLKYDTIVKEKFTDLLKAAENGELFGWYMTKDSWLAHIILLDQMSRQVYRGHGDCFKNDKGCLIFVEMGWEHYKNDLKGYEYMFALMPFMHAENLVHQRKCVRLFYDDYALVEKSSPEFKVYDFMLNHVNEHIKTIEQFGRFPKRNKPMGRESTDAELTYMNRDDIKNRQY